jgi:hypothetical protein
MSSAPLYAAAICIQCQQATLVLDGEAERGFCGRCGGRRLPVPGAKFTAGDCELFAQLADVVQVANLSKTEAALLAGELESVGLRWEAPDLVLKRVSARLHGLPALYAPEQDYSRLLLVVSLLLTIVCARMVGPAREPKQISHGSGVRPAVRSDALDGQAVERNKKSS